MTKIRQLIAATLGLFVAIFGVRLRLLAYDLAWPKQFSYSGSRENTIWAIRERTYEDIGMILMVFGLIVLLVVLVNWLWTPSDSSEVGRT